MFTRRSERYRLLVTRAAGLKFAADVARGPELGRIRAEQDAILAELRTLEPAVINRGDSLDGAAQPSTPELEFGRGVKLPQDWREFQRGAQKAFEAEIDQMVKQKLTNK